MSQCPPSTEHDIFNFLKLQDVNERKHVLFESTVLVLAVFKCLHTLKRACTPHDLAKSASVEV